MQGIGSRQINPQLREMVVEASLALARLDAERLEELALSCQSLNRNLAQAKELEGDQWERQAREASKEMAVFERVLAATRTNLEVMNRVRERRSARLEYGGFRGPWALAERRDGDH
jgi:hypothetical protein